MFQAVAVALAALAVAGAAAAKDNKKKDKKEEADKKSGGMMEEGGKDPAETETLDEDGAFVPGQQKKAEAAAAAEAAEAQKPKPKKPPVARKTWGIFGEMLIGFGRAPLEGPINPDTGDNTTGDGTVFTFMLGGHYDLTPAFRLMARVPYTVGTVKSGLQDASTQALGVPEVAARLRLSPPGDTEWAVRLAVGIPVAQGNPDFNIVADPVGQAQNFLQRTADAGNGWHDQELFALKRIPITPAFLFSHHADKFRVGGELKVSIMPKIGDDFASPNLPTGTLSRPTLATTVLLGGSASYEIFTHAHLALAAWARYGIVEQVKYEPTADASTPSHFQLALEPKFLMQFGHVVPGVGFVIPVGGPLGGDIYGFRVHVDVIF
jgi:hypothetical protein